VEPSLSLPQILFQSRQSAATGIIPDGFQLDGDRMFLHAPPSGAPPATVEFDSVEFTGEPNVQLAARLDNTDSEEVILFITVWSDERVSLYNVSTSRSCGRKERQLDFDAAAHWTTTCDYYVADDKWRFEQCPRVAMD